jgi:hypothetical protein
MNPMIMSASVMFQSVHSSLTSDKYLARLWTSLLQCGAFDAFFKSIDTIMVENLIDNKIGQPDTS